MRTADSLNHEVDVRIIRFAMIVFPEIRSNWRVPLLEPSPFGYGEVPYMLYVVASDDPTKAHSTVAYDECPYRELTYAVSDYDRASGMTHHQMRLSYFPRHHTLLIDNLDSHRNIIGRSIRMMDRRLSLRAEWWFNTPEPKDNSPMIGGHKSSLTGDEPMIGGDRVHKS